MARISLVDRFTVWRERPRAVAALVGLALVACLVSILAAPGLPGWLGAGLALTMIAVAAIDMRFFIIPNELSAAAFALALVNAAVTTPDAIWGAIGIALLRAAVLGLLFLGLRALYQRLRGREGLGLGDVKLAAVGGAWLDWASAPIAIEIAALGAISAFVVSYFAAGRRLDTTLRFPFGLFLGPGIWLGWLIEVTLLAPPVL